MAQVTELDDNDYEEIATQEESAEHEWTQPKPSNDYEAKKRRAEHILEQARLREMFGYDIDYED